MEQVFRQPTKEEVRNWLKREIARHRPPPTPEQIRRQLGWDLVEMRRSKQS